MKLRLSLLALFAVFVAVYLTHTFVNQALAQSSPDTRSHSMQQDSQPASLASSLNKGESKITGCIRSDNGKYVAETKLHKKIWLSGPEDFAPHAGHTVILYGTYLNGSTPATDVRVQPQKSQEPPPGRQESNFQVSKVEMLSNTCAPIKAKTSDRP
jgi:hypothetical protein